MKKGLIALAMASALAPVSALAELSYNYVEGALALYPSAGEDQTWMGFDGRGSFAIAPQIFVFGGLKFLTDDYDYTAFHVGGGYKVSIDSKMDVWGGVSLEHQKFDLDIGRVCTEFGCFGGGSASTDDTTFALRGGMRMQIDPKLEVGGNARLVMGDYDYLGLTGTARYALQQNLVLLGEVDLFDGDIGFLGGVTFFF